MSLPLEPLTKRLYDLLDSELTHDVRYAGTSGPAGSEYVALQVASSIPDDTKTTRSHTITITLRCHTEHAEGEARPLDAQALASDVADVLQRRTIDIPEARWADLHLTSPSTSENTYDMGSGRRALDYILTYTIRIQDLQPNA